MNIDNNEMPEPTEEYPSHMVEETADEEEITDHQTVADILSNGETYESEPENGYSHLYPDLSVERLREVVEEVLEEADEEIFPPPSPLADRGVTRIDVSQIPSGMTLNDAVEHYRTTGTIITDSTITTNASETAWVNLDSDSTSAVEAPIRREPEEQKKEPIEEIPPTPEEIARIKKERKFYHAAQLKYKREILVRDMAITKNDLIIGFTTSNQNLYHIDIEGKYSIQELMVPYKDRGRRRSSINIRRSMSFCFYFDKHMNRLIGNVDGKLEDGSETKIITSRTGRRIYLSQAIHSHRAGDAIEQQFVIVDKQAFIESKGGVWKIKYRQNIDFKKLMDAKKRFQRMFSDMERLLTWMRITIEEVHPQEDYDIMYTMTRNMSKANEFALLLKFRDITISNSVEMEHHLGDILVRSSGLHFYAQLRNKIKSSLTGNIYGMRLSYTPADAALQYQHSHLTKTMLNFGSFCTGSENYGNGDGDMTEMELQSHIFRMHQFISWESLEGGPHNKMEQISIHGKQVVIGSTSIDKGKIVGNEYINYMVQMINKTEQKFNVFANAFELIANGNGDLKFVVDYNMFFQKFMELFDSNKVKMMHDILGERPYTYNSVTQTFHFVTNSEMTSSRQIIDKARMNMRDLNPVYMNGKYLRPHLSTLSTENILGGIRFAPEPNFMKDLAQLILFKLTDKLEKHGNTSTDKGKET